MTLKALPVKVDNNVMATKWVPKQLATYCIRTNIGEELNLTNMQRRR